MAKSDMKMFVSNADELMVPATRRQFLRLMGAGGALVLLPSVFSACSDDDDPITPRPRTAVTLDLSNDTGILNYAYVLEQLEAAFYTVALTQPGFAALSANEKEVLTDVQKHEVIHREFFRNVLGTGRVPDVAFNTTTVNTMTATRDALLRNSQLLEDTGVAAYNGAGKYLQSATNLLIAGKIVSVEARHAAAFRDMRDLTGRLFAGNDVVDTTDALDVKSEPAAVLAAVASLNVIDTNQTNLTVSAGPRAAVPATPDKNAPAPT